MNEENCALKLVDEIILYYDARSKKHQNMFVCRRMTIGFHITSTGGWVALSLRQYKFGIFGLCAELLAVRNIKSQFAVVMSSCTQVCQVARHRFHELSCLFCIHRVNNCCLDVGRVSTKIISTGTIVVLDHFCDVPSQKALILWYKGIRVSYSGTDRVAEVPRAWMGLQ